MSEISEAVAKVRGRRRLMAMKSIAKDTHSRVQFREAVRAIDGRPRP